MQNMTLVKIAAVGGIATCTMGLVLQNKINNNIKQSQFFKESMNLVRHHKAAVYYLGEPIKDAKINSLNGGNNVVTSTSGRFEVKLRGSKQSGKLFIHTSKQEHENYEGWKLDYLEMEIDDQPGKRLVLKSEQPISNS